MSGGRESSLFCPRRSCVRLVNGRQLNPSSRRWFVSALRIFSDTKPDKVAGSCTILFLESSSFSKFVQSPISFGSFFITFRCRSSVLRWTHFPIVRGTIVIALSEAFTSRKAPNSPI
eukprot:964510-Rhodomonas_salina.2